MVNPLSFMGNQWTHQGQGGGGTDQIGFAMAIAASTVVMTIIQQFLFNHFRGYLEQFIHKIVVSLDPYVEIRFDKHTDDGGTKNHEAYAAIGPYLSARCSVQAPRLKANFSRDIRTPVLRIDKGERVSDVFKGIKVWWQLKRDDEASKEYGRPDNYYALSFRKSDWIIVVEEYVKHVMEEGVAAVARNRQLKLYSNSSKDDYWICIKDFDHSATFDTLAMEKDQKQEIVDDLIWFSNARDYYRKIGKPWKRGYLLYGPPGTGKSTMIAAMANLLSYDVYDLELTAVTSNSGLKKLLNKTPSNSIVVIEDIDCSSDVAGQRDQRPHKQPQQHQNEEEKKEKVVERVTLSGLLNCVDGLFSANDGGRLMVFTTNHIESLDPALIRTGRMDMRIKMSYCGFEAFKALAKSYLGVAEHELFPKIGAFLKETNTTPADVAENLIAKTTGEGFADACLQRLIKVLEKKLEDNKLRSLKTDEITEHKEMTNGVAVKGNGTCGNENGFLN